MYLAANTCLKLDYFVLLNVFFSPRYKKPHMIYKITSVSFQMADVKWVNVVPTDFDAIFNHISVRCTLYPI